MSHINNICKIKNQQNNTKENIVNQLLVNFELQNKQIEILTKENNEIKTLQKENKDSKIIKILQKEIKNLKEKIMVNNDNSFKISNNQIGDNQIININNSVKMIAFGKEELDYISDNVCKEFLKKGFQSLPSLIEHTHFNIDKPEFHNVYISNIKTGKAFAYNGHNFNIHKESKIIDQLKADGCQYIDAKFKELREKGLLSEAMITKLERFIEKRDDEPQQTNLYDDIKLILYNKRDIVINTKNKIKKNNNSLLVKI